MAKVIAIRRKKTVRIHRSDGRDITITTRGAPVVVKAARKPRSG
jgi:hypothetical protein